MGRRKRNLRKKRWLMWTGALAAAGVLALGLDSRLAVREYRVESAHVTAPVRLAVLTDLHACFYGEGQADLLSAVAVSFVGIISFVGLVAPHIMRRFVGSDYRFLIPGSALMGGTLMLCADVVSRSVIPPTVLPIGAITSFLGAPVFLSILLKGGRQSCWK